MKKILFSLCLLSVLSAIANHTTKPLVAEIVSNEILNQDGLIPIEIKIRVLDDSLSINEIVEGFSDSIGIFSIGRQGVNINYSLNDTGLISFNIEYQNDSLPFYPQKFEIKINYSHEGENNYYKLSGNIYFTPYGTTEIWNEHDFNTINRVWLIGSGEKKLRKHVDKSEIPICTLPQNYEDSIPEDEITYDYIDGLAYAIPRQLTEEELLPPPIICEQWTYTRTIKGQVVGKFEQDNQNGLQISNMIPLKGLEVRLRRKRTISGANHTIGRTTTDANGNFKFVIDRKFWKRISRYFHRSHCKK